MARPENIVNTDKKAVADLVKFPDVKEQNHEWEDDYDYTAF